MAGIFAPDINFNIQPESPVAPVEAPSINVGDLLSAGSNFLATQGGDRRERRSGQDPNLAVFAEDIQKLEAIRQQSGDSAAALFEKGIAQKFASFGIDLNKDYERVYEKTTGRPFTYYAKDSNDIIREGYLADERWKTFFMTSKLNLPPDASTEEIEKLAIMKMAEMDVHEDELRRMHLKAEHQWTSKTETAYNKVSDNFLESVVSAAQNTGEQGLTADHVEVFKVQWNALKAGALRQPPGVSNEAFESQQDRLEKVDDFIETLEQVTNNQSMLNRYARHIFEAFQNTGDLHSVVVGLSVLQDPNSVLPYMSQNKMRALIENLAKVPIQKGSGDSSLGPVLHPNFWKKFEVLNPGERALLLETSATLAGVVNPDNSPKALGMARDFFTALAGGLKTGGSGDFLSPEFLKGSFGENLRKNFTTLLKLDPDGAERVRTFLTEGLSTEMAKQRANLMAIEGSVTGASWDGKQYKLTFKEEDFPPDTITEFYNLLKNKYPEAATAGRSLLDAAARDGFVRLVPYSFTRKVLESGNLKYLPKAVKRRNAIDIIEDAINFLNPNAADDELNSPLENPIEIKNTVVNRLSPNAALDTAPKDDTSLDEPKKGGLLGMGGFPSSEGLSPGERAVRKMNVTFPSLTNSAEAATLDGESGSTEGVTDFVLDKVAKVESNNNPNAVSRVGAVGLYQIMPDTAEDPGFGVKPLSTGSLVADAPPQEQRRFARDYLQAMLDRYDGDMALALAAYNAGPGRVDKFVSKGKPLPAETIDYVQKYVNEGVLDQSNSVPRPTVGRSND